MKKVNWRKFATVCGAGTVSTLALSLVPAVAQQPPVLTASFLTPPKQGAASSVQPAQPFGSGAQESPTPSPADTTAGGASSDFLSAFGGGAAPRQEQTTASPGTNNVANTTENAGKAPTDVGDFLAKSEEALGFDVQRRSPVITDPFIRGYHTNQIITYLDGGWAYPARIDLDTIVSKIDATNISDVLVVKGPYNVRYGSGFTFLDIATIAPPRYDTCGFENHGQILSGFKSNGQQLRERGDLYGGNQDVGYRIGYTLGVGNDYSVPNDFIFRDFVTGQTVNFGNKIPSSYNNQSIDYAFGFDLTPHSTLTLYGMNLEQRNVEIPGFPFDFRRLESQSYSARYECRDQCYFDKLTTDVWYAYTHFTGDNGITVGPNGTQIPLPYYGKRIFYYNPLINPSLPPPRPDSEEPQFAFPFLAISVDGGSMTTGIRQIITWGHPKDFEFNLGWDWRLLSQRDDEYDFLTATTAITGFTNYPIPRSHALSRGLFADAVAQPNENLTIKSGVRMDITDVDVDSFDQGLTENQVRQALGNDNLNHEYLLWNGYVSSEYKLGKQVSWLAGIGTGQRPPSLTELYAISPYMAEIQRTFNFFRGDPNLAPEQNLQLDMGFKSDFEWIRMGASGYVSWIHNYITYQPNYNVLPKEVSQFTQQDGQPAPGNNRDSLPFTFANTDLALLTGFEAYTEVNVMPWLTAYATASYVYGTDLSRGDRVTPDQIDHPDPNNPSVIIPGLFHTRPDSEPLPSIVPFEARLGIRVHETSSNPRWTIDFSARHDASQNRVAASLGEEPTGPFTVFDLRGYWQINERWSLNGGIENLFDKFYHEHLDIITGRGVWQPGRNYYVVAEMKF
jgi:outer membrane receptor protein involved in Fe transport